MKNLVRSLLVRPGAAVSLKGIDPGDTRGIHKEAAAERLSRNLARMAELQYMLYAEAKRSLLVVLQGIDAGGKDGAIGHAMSGMNPQGVSVTSFKVPEGAEKRHDYLWRVHEAVPEQGKIGIFNRSHYEDVLVVRVHNLVPEEVWSKRYAQINDFERMLSENNVVILKFLLHISKEEQAERFKERLKDTTRNWKFSPADLQERKYWDAYAEAYDAMLRKCSPKWAPWYVIPANKKWFRNLAISEVMVEALEGMNLKFPDPPAKLPSTRFK